MGNTPQPQNVVAPQLVKPPAKPSLGPQPVTGGVPSGDPSSGVALQKPLPPKPQPMALHILRGILGALGGTPNTPGEGNGEFFKKALGGILGGAMTGLAGGMAVQSQRGGPRGPLAALAGGFGAVQDRERINKQIAAKQKQQAFDNNATNQTLDLRKKAAALALNDSIQRQEYQAHMEKIADQSHDDAKKELAVKLAQVNDEWAANLRNSGIEPVPGMHGFKNYDVAYQAALKRFPQLAAGRGFKVYPIKDPSTGLYELYEPTGGQVPVQIDGLKEPVYMPSDQAASYYTQQAHDKFQATIDRYREGAAQADENRAIAERDKAQNQPNAKGRSKSKAIPKEQALYDQFVGSIRMKNWDMAETIGSKLWGGKVNDPGILGDREQFYNTLESEVANKGGFGMPVYLNGRLVGHSFDGGKSMIPAGGE